jgi:antitoxin StbD
MDPILAPSSVGISELKANPNAVLDAADGMPVAVLNRNKPIAYLLSSDAWEAICDRLEDIELRQQAEARLNDGQKPVKISLNDL